MRLLCGKGLTIALLFLYTLHATGQSITKTTAGAAATTSLIGGSSNWTSFNVSQIQNPDGTNASVTISGKKSSYHIRATNWGYATGGSGGFPAGATLSGIKVEIKRNVSQGAAVDAQNLSLVINGAVTGSARSRNRTQWTSQSGYVTYGSTSDKWGTSLTISDIVNSTFGVQVAAKGALKGNSNSVANIDHIRITIYYNLNVYYSKSTGSLSSLSTWGRNSDGTGTAPTNFTNDGQIFILTNRSSVSLDAALAISGANSKLVVGDISNALAKTTLTIPSTFAYSGILDCSTKDGTTANSSDVIISNTNIPTLGNLEFGTTVTYNAVGDQAVSQANYDNLTISGTGTKTIQSTGTGIRVDGVFTVSSGATLALNGQELINSSDPAGTAACVVNNGTISGSGEVYLTGDGLSIISGTGSISTLETDNPNDVSILAGANQTISTSMILSRGSFTNNGTFAMGAGSTIYRDQGVFSATSPGTNAYDVSYTSSFLDDGITTNAPGNELAGTNLRNVSVDLPATESITLNTTRTVKGNFSINTGTFSAGANTINLAGNFINNSSFNASTSTVVLNGSTATTQTVGGTGTIAFATLTVNTTGTGGVNLAKDITVTTALTLTNGKVITGNNTLIYSLATGAVTRTNGYVAGNLRKNVSTGASIRTFEVGTTNYTPIQVSFASVTTAGTLDATVTSGDNPNIGSSNMDASKSVNTYWEVAKPSGSAFVYTTYGITATYTSAENDATGNATGYKLGKYAGSAWSYIVPGTLGSSTQLTVPSSSFSAASGFGQFQVGVQGLQPVISIQPSNQTTCNSASTNFSATASSGIISSIVWQISTDNGASYSNLTISSPYSVTSSSLPTILNAAATTTLNISNSAGLNGYLYRAVFTNVTGSANSNGGLLTANSNPAFSTQPVAQTTCAGSLATFSVVATGGSLTYQWRKGGNNISGATSSSYSISSVVTGDAANYDVIVTNTCSSVTSSAVALTVNELPVITTQPTGQTVCSGNTSTFTIVAAGSGLSYQWQKDNIALVNGVNGVSGATAATLAISPTPVSAAGIYNVVVTGNCSPFATSNDVVLTVDEGAVITGQPSGQTVCGGTTNVQFTVAATGTGLTYQWKKDGNNLSNGANISGATTATLTLATAAAADAGNYTVVVGTTNCTSGITSNAAALVITTPLAPSVSIAMTSGSNPTCSGTAVIFTATPTNGGTPSYQWQKDGINAGTNSATYTDAGTIAGSITCIMTTSISCVTATTATSSAIALNLTTQVTPSVSIAVTSGSNPTCSGSSVTFTATPTNGGTPSYQWKKDGINVGTNSATYSDAGTTAGSITCIMTSSVSCVTTTTATSNAIAMSITAKVTPIVSIAVTSGFNPTCSGTSVTFTATPTNGGTPSYQWKKDGVNVGANSSTYTDAGTTAGSITCIMTSSLTCITTTNATSNAIALTVTANVTPSVSIAITSGTNPTCSATSVTFTATPTNGGTPFYQWTKDGVNVGANSSSYTDAGTIAGSISCIMTTSISCVTTITATSNAIALNITAKVTPLVSIAISSGSNPTCPGSSVTFTATPTNGGTPSYQWKKDGINVGTNSATYTDAGTTAGSITCIMTTSISCVTSATASSNVIDLSIMAGKWLGGTDGNWSNPSNWCGGSVPSAGTDVIIPNANAPYPVLSADVSVKTLEIESGATVTIGTHTLTVNDVITGTGSITGSSTSNLTINGPGSSTNSTLRFTAGSQVLKNLTVNNITATLNTPLSITAGVAAGTVTVTNGVLASGGNLTLRSDALGTARIAPGTAAGNYITGDVSVERYIPHNSNRAWRLLSIPTIGQTIHEAWQENQAADVDPLTGYGTIVTSNSANWQANGYDEKTPGNSLLAYTQPTDSWYGVPNTAAPIATTGGYFIYIRGDRSVKQSSSILATNATTLRSKGTLYLGTQPAITIPADKFGLIGNIYPSAIDMRNISASGGSATTSFSVWDPKLIGSYGLGAYQTFTSDNGNYIVTPGGGSYGTSGSINNTIQSGQAFFAEAIGTDGTIQLTEDAKTSGSTSGVFSPPPGITAKRLIANLYAMTDSITNLADGTLQLFDDSFDNGVDGLDARKHYNFGENFYITAYNNDLVVEKRKLPAANDTIYFSIEILKRKSYQVELIARDLAENNLTAWFEDSYTKTSTPLNLNGTTTVKFNVDANAASSVINRFKIVFKQDVVLAVTFTNIKAYQQNSNVAVEWNVTNQANTSGYEIEKSNNGSDFTKVGTKIATIGTGSTISYQWLDVNAMPGDNFYRIISIDKDGSKHYSQVVKVNISNKDGNVSIYPNPVKDGIVKLSFTGMAIGNYTVRLLGSNGAMLLSKQLTVSGTNSLHTIQLSSKLPGGNYLLEITHPDKTKSIEHLIIAK